MRMPRHRFAFAIIATVGLLAAGDAFATGSAAAFHAFDPSYFPTIWHNGNYLWNSDTSNWSYVTADLGVSSATSMTVHVRGDTQGYSATGSYSSCYIDARRLSDAYSTIGAIVYTSGYPAGFYTSTVSISGLPSGQYAFELVCGLGPIVSGYAGEQIWAWY